jgi:beta-glucosidase
MGGSRARFASRLVPRPNSSQALGEILFGAVNPSGKLPITMERRAQDNPAFASFATDPNASVINYNVSYNSVGNSEGLFIGYRGHEKNHIQLDTDPCIAHES